MKIYALGDLHLSFLEEITGVKKIKQDKIKLKKPMDKFGQKWKKHYRKIFFNWTEEITNEDDIVLIPGDISWTMELKEAEPDLNFISQLPGTKIMIKGNHDYWWQSISRIREFLPDNIFALQYDSFCLQSVAIGGTRGWVVPNENEFTDHDHKIYKREVNRLQLSLESIQDDYENLIIMFHYIPVNMAHERNEFIDLMSEYNVDTCIYGHLHGKEAHQNRLEGEKWGIEFKLVSADFLDFTPELLLKKSNE